MARKIHIDPKDSLICLIDHQSGLFQLVKDLELDELRRNVVALAKLAKIIKLPVITTASVPDGPNGPLIPEIAEYVPDAIYVPRKGQINAWDNPEFVKAVKKTGRKTLIMAGTLSNVCLAFPAISAVQDGYTVYALMDASGCFDVFSKDIVLARLVQASVIPIDVMALIAELQQTWARPETPDFLDLYAFCLPHYKLLIESFERAKRAALKGDEDAKETTTVKKL